MTTNQSNPAQVKNADGTELSGIVDISAGGFLHSIFKRMERCGRWELMVLVN